MIYDVISLLYCFYTDFECREGEFDLDLEDIMVMEAIWLSIQVLLHIQIFKFTILLMHYLDLLFGKETQSLSLS